MEEMAGTNHPSLNCDTIEDYRADPRIACQYGTKCYQKNPVHVNKYKHPPKVQRDVFRKGAKRTKLARPIQSNKNGHNRDDISDGSSGSESPKRKVPRGSPSKGKDDNQASSSKDDTPTERITGGVSAFEDEPMMPPSPSDIRENIKQKFLFEMPEDFYSFWELCQSLNGKNPALAFQDVGLKLVGPYDLLSSRFKIDESMRKIPMFLLHWRYYFDPPGFQTVLKGDDKKQFHIGYFRDNPKSLPVFLASNCAAKDGVFVPLAENIFGAVNSVLNDAKKSSTPFLQTKLPKLQKALQEYAKENNISLESKTPAMRQRDRKTVSKTFNGLGLLVPVEKKTEVGYRELIETDANLRRILNRIVESERQDSKDKALDQLQQVITAANIANDECDFGTSVELGLDLFAFEGLEFNQSALQLLSTGYNLLGWPEFAKVAEIHINNRRKGANLDMFAV